MLKIRSEQVLTALLPGDPLSLGTEQACPDVLDPNTFRHSSDCISFRQAQKQFHGTTDSFVREIIKELVGTFESIPSAFGFFDPNSYTTHGYLSDLKRKYAPLSRFSRDVPLDSIGEFPDSVYQSPLVSSCSCSLEAARRFRLTGTVLTHSQLQVFLRRLMQVGQVNVDTQAMTASNFHGDLAANSGDHASVGSQEITGVEELTPSSCTVAAGSVVLNNVPLSDSRMDDTFSLTQWLQVAEGWKLSHPVARLVWERFIYSHPCQYPYKDSSVTTFKCNLSEFLQFLLLQAHSPQCPAIYSHSVDLSSIETVCASSEMLSRFAKMDFPLYVDVTESFDKLMEQFKNIYPTSNLSSDKIEALRGYLSMRSRQAGSMGSRFVACNINSFLLLCQPSNVRRLFSPHITASAHNLATWALVKRSSSLHAAWEEVMNATGTKGGSQQFQRFGSGAMQSIMTTVYAKEIAPFPQRQKLHGQLQFLFKHSAELQSALRSGDAATAVNRRFGWGGAGVVSLQGHLLHQLERVVLNGARKDTSSHRGAGHARAKQRFVGSLLPFLSQSSASVVAGESAPLFMTLALPITIHSIPAMSSMLEPHHLCALGYVCDIMHVAGVGSGLTVDAALAGVVSNVVSVASTLASVPSHDGVQEAQSDFSYIAAGNGITSAAAGTKLTGNSVLRAMNTAWTTSDHQTTIAHLCPAFAFNSPPSASVYALSCWLQSQLGSYTRVAGAFNTLFPEDIRAATIAALSKSQVQPPSQQLQGCHGAVSGLESVNGVEGVLYEVVRVKDNKCHALSDGAVQTYRYPDQFSSSALITHTHATAAKSADASWVARVRAPSIVPFATDAAQEMIKVHHDRVAVLAYTYNDRVSSAQDVTSPPPASAPELSQCIQSILNVLLSPNPVRPEFQINELLSLQLQRVTLQHLVLPVCVATISPYLSRVCAVALVLHIKGLVSLHSVYRVLKAGVLVILKENKIKSRESVLETFRTSLVRSGQVVDADIQTIQNSAITFIDKHEVGRSATMSAPHPHVSETTITSGEVRTDQMLSGLRHDLFLSSQFARKGLVLPSSSVMPTLLIQFIASQGSTHATTSSFLHESIEPVIEQPATVGDVMSADLPSTIAPPSTIGWTMGQHPYLCDPQVSGLYFTGDKQDTGIVRRFVPSPILPLRANAAKYQSRYIPSSIASFPTASTLVGVVYSPSQIPIVCYGVASDTVHIPRPPTYPVSPMLTAPPPHIPPIAYLTNDSMPTPVPVNQVTVQQQPLPSPPVLYLSHCYGSTVTALWPASAVLISNCSGTIYLGAAGTVVVSNCYNLELHVTCHTLTIQNCVGVAVHAFTTTSPVIQSCVYISMHARTSIYASQYLDAAAIGIKQLSLSREKQHWGIMAALRQFQQLGVDMTALSSASLVLNSGSPVEGLPAAFPAAIVQPVLTQWKQPESIQLPANYNLFNQALIPSCYVPPASFLAAISAAHYGLVGAKPAAGGLAFPSQFKGFARYRAVMPFACFLPITPRLQDIAHSHVALSEALQLPGTVANVTATFTDLQRVDFKHLASEARTDRPPRNGALRPYPYPPASVQLSSNPLKVPFALNDLTHNQEPCLTVQLSTHCPKPQAVETEERATGCACGGKYCRACLQEHSAEAVFLSQLHRAQVTQFSPTVPSTEFMFAPSSVNPGLAFGMLKDAVVPIGIVGSAKPKARIIAPLLETVALLRPIHPAEHQKLRAFVRESVNGSAEAKHALDEIKKNLHLYLRVRSVLHQLVLLRSKFLTALGVTSTQSNVWTNILASANTTVAKILGRIASQQGVKNSLEQLQCVTLLPSQINEENVMFSRKHARHIRLAERLLEIVMSTTPLSLSHVNDLQCAPFFFHSAEETTMAHSDPTPFLYTTTTFVPCPAAHKFVNQELHLGMMDDNVHSHVCSQQCIFGGKNINGALTFPSPRVNALSEATITDLPHADALRASQALEDLRGVFRAVKNSPQVQRDTAIDTLVQRFRTWLGAKDKQVSVDAATVMLEALLKS